MKLTIGIPNFNGGNNLKEAIESCQHIKLPKEDIEILIVDNQSTDDSISTIEKLGEKITNIRLWQNSTNVGRIGNWNTVLEKAEGDYLILLFTNDKIYGKNNIEKILKILDENQTISLCISALIKKEKNGSYIKWQIKSTSPALNGSVEATFDKTDDSDIYTGSVRIEWPDPNNENWFVFATSKITLKMHLY